MRPIKNYYYANLFGATGLQEVVIKLRKNADRLLRHYKIRNNRTYINTRICNTF